jgi:NADH:ubiquinone reductase (H+-translocating)
VRINTRVEDIRASWLKLSHDGQNEEISAKTILWGAGVKASPLGERLARAAGVEPDRGGRVPVQPDLSVAGHPEVFVLGDLAHSPDGEGNPLPRLAPVAMQQGRYVARLIRNRSRSTKVQPFRYHDRGTMATVGRSRAVAEMGSIQLNGRLAWFAWLFVHLMYIVTFENRVLILLQWAWDYVTRNRAARLIIDQHANRTRETGGTPKEELTEMVDSG